MKCRPAALATSRPSCGGNFLGLNGSLAALFSGASHRQDATSGGVQGVPVLRSQAGAAERAAAARVFCP